MRTCAIDAVVQSMQLMINYLAFKYIKIAVMYFKAPPSFTNGHFREDTSLKSNGFPS